MSTRKLRQFGLFGLVALAAAGLGGCNFGSVDGDLSPELMTYTKRPVDVGNAMALTFDSDYHGFWADLSRASLTDRPSRLAVEPIAH